MSPVSLDAIDRRILDVLQADCSLSNQELADRVHTSPATCLRRVKRLVDSGVVERRIAILAPDRVGAGIGAVVEVTLERQAVELSSTFEARAVADAEVQQVYRVNPGPDFVLVVAVADMDGYQALAKRLFTSDANVRNVRAYFVVERPKFEPRVTLPPPTGGR